MYLPHVYVSFWHSLKRPVLIFSGKIYLYVRFSVRDLSLFFRMWNPTLVGFARRSEVDLKSKHFADIYRQKYFAEWKSWEPADKSCKNRRFSACRGTGAICIHSYSIKNADYADAPTARSSSLSLAHARDLLSQPLWSCCTLNEYSQPMIKCNAKAAATAGRDWKERQRRVAQPKAASA